MTPAFLANVPHFVLERIEEEEEEEEEEEKRPRATEAIKREEEEKATSAKEKKSYSVTCVQGSMSPLAGVRGGRKKKMIFQFWGWVLERKEEKVVRKLA